MNINTPKTNKIHVGIDVSKNFIDVALSKQSKKFKYDQAGLEAMIEWVTHFHPKQDLHVIFEPTGGYEVQLAKFLQNKEIVWSSPNPLRVRQFARAIGVMAKTDKIDSFILAQFGKQFSPKPQQLNSQNILKLQALMTRRDQVVQMLVMEKTALESTREKTCQKEINNSIRRLKRDLERLEKQISSHIQEDGELNKKSEAMQEICGVGPQTAHILCAYLPELGEVNKREIASLAGLAPVIRESGKWKGKVTIGPGRIRVRRALYMAAISASRFNDVLKEIYQKLRDQGKPAKVALCAIARRLAIALNSKIKSLNLKTETTFSEAEAGSAGMQPS